MDGYIGVKRVRRSGNSLVITIRKDEAVRLGIAEGDLVEVSIRPLELRRPMRPELRAAFDQVWKEGEAGFHDLAER